MASISYKGYLIAPGIYKREPGGYVVKGYIYDFEKNQTEITPYFDLDREYATEEEAEKIFIGFAKQHIDKILS